MRTPTRQSTHLVLLGALPLLAGSAALSAWRFAAWLTAATILAAVLLELHRRSRTDRPTGLANHRTFRAAARPAPHRHTAVLLLDLNDTDRNDTGPRDTDPRDTGTGDTDPNTGTGTDRTRLLRPVADLLRLLAPPPALPYRLHGTTFAVVLPEIDHPEQAYDLAGRIAATLGTVALDGRLVTLAAAIGVAVSAPGELTSDELTHRAALAMNRAKSLGPDTRWAIWQHPGEPDTTPLAAA